MTQDVPLNFGDQADVRFFQAVQEMLSGSAPSFKLTVGPAANQIQVLNQSGGALGNGDAQASISIAGLYRWARTAVTCTVSGPAGNYDIYACTSGPNVYTPSTDSSPTGFTLVSVASGQTPSGPYASRKVATCVFDGTNVTSLHQLVGQADVQAQTGITLPSGLMLPFGGATPPAGWLTCDGSLVATATYPGLYAAIGTAYNADHIATFGGSIASDHFALPDSRGRVMMAPDNLGSTGAAGRVLAANTLGQADGAETHTLTVAEMPSHAHTDTGHTHIENSHNHADAGHTHHVIGVDHGAGHAFPLDGGGDVPINGGGGGSQAALAWQGSGGGVLGGTGAFFGLEAGSSGAGLAAATATIQSASAAIAATGGGGAHSIKQPYLTIGGYIIKV